MIPDPFDLTADSMTREWTLYLAFSRPPKGLAANDRAHWAIKSTSNRLVRTFVASRVREAGIPKLDRIRVDVVWVVGDQRRRDADGPDPFCKAIYDGIGADKGISAHVVPDDTPEYMEKPRLVIRYEACAVNHFEVTVTEVTV